MACPGHMQLSIRTRSLDMLERAWICIHMELHHLWPVVSKPEPTMLSSVNFMTQKPYAHGIALSIENITAIPYLLLGGAVTLTVYHYTLQFVCDVCHNTQSMISITFWESVCPSWYMGTKAHVHGMGFHSAYFEEIPLWENMKMGGYEVEKSITTCCIMDPRIGESTCLELC
jgi:hypothetical protein